MRKSCCILGVVPMWLVLLGAAQARDALTFAKRVRFQTAIDKLYFAQTSSTAADLEVVSSIAEQRVRRFVASAILLGRRHASPVTSSMLRQELDRMARDTRSPSRLQAIFAALDNDRFIVEECLVRPVITERIARESWSGTRDSKEGDSVDTWDASLTALIERAHLIELPAVSTADGEAPSTSTSLGQPDACLPENSWNNASLDDFPEPVMGHTAVWTGSLMLIWGGNVPEDPRHGWRYDPALDQWSPMRSAGSIEDGRTGHTAVWTGTKMVVWGGYLPPSDLTPRNTGAVYDPLTDTWTPTPLAGAPSARSRHTAVWSGTDMLIWGGYGPLGPVNSGSRYNPTSNSWTAIATSSAPVARHSHVAQWSGSQMLVWGGEGSNSTTLATGGRYSPTTNSWFPMSNVNAPSGRGNAASVWTGSTLVVWGGQHGISSGGDYPVAGGRYDPSLDTWRSTSTTGAPSGRIKHTAVWTGTRLLIYGGNRFDLPVDGAVYSYDPAGDGWQTLDPAGSPTQRWQHSAVWTGAEMIVWGGNGPAATLDDVDAAHSGARFVASSPAWVPMKQSIAPWRANGTPRGVWVGGRVHYPTGGRAYDPALDTWFKTQRPPLSDLDLHDTVKRVFVSADNTLLLNGGAAGMCQYDALRDRWSKRQLEE